jgi:DNA-binding LacI/PurR family transcriptional regulator/DNA-binding transcriptional regulator YhcF (GntR family)
VQQLARNAGVSLVSMHRAVRNLGLQGSLVVKKHPGIIVAGGTPPAEQRVPSGQKWEKLRCTIEQRLLDWTYPPGSLLPPAGELASTYGVHFATLRKALEHLERRRLLQRQGLRYMVPRLAASTGSLTVLVIGPGDEKGMYRGMDRHVEIMRSIEEQANAQNFRFQTCGFSLQKKSLAYTGVNRNNFDPVRFMARDEVAGAIFLDWLPDSTSQMALHAVCACGKPVAVLDEKGDESLPLLCKKYKAIQVFAIAHSKADGHAVGTYLLRRGHRKAAYCSMYHKNKWSLRRLQGLNDSFEMAGFPGAILECTTELESEWELVPELADIPRRGIARRLQPVYAAFTALERELPLHLADQIFDLRIQTGQIETELELTRIVRPLMEKAHSDRQCTAWVCANDRLALGALSYCAEMGIAVPRDISIIGFDDSFEALHRNLSSYNFAPGVYVRRMLDFILRNSRRSASSRFRPVEIPGYVTERGTTALRQRKS